MHELGCTKQAAQASLAALFPRDGPGYGQGGPRGVLIRYRSAGGERRAAARAIHELPQDSEQLVGGLAPRLVDEEGVPLPNNKLCFSKNTLFFLKKNK